MVWWKKIVFEVHIDLGSISGMVNYELALILGKVLALYESLFFLIWKKGLIGKILLIIEAEWQVDRDSSHHFYSTFCVYLFSIKIKLKITHILLK